MNLADVLTIFNLFPQYKTYVNEKKLCLGNKTPKKKKTKQNTRKNRYVRSNVNFI